MTIPGEQTPEARAASYRDAGVVDPAAPKVENQGKPGYDVFGAPVSGTPLPGGGVAAPVPGAVPSPSEYYSRVGTEPAPVAAETVEDVQARRQKEAQGVIDNINKIYDAKVADQTTVNDSRTRGTNAISMLNGLGGSSEAQIKSDDTSNLNKREIDAINAERGNQIIGIMGKISDAAYTEAKQSRDEARQSQQDIAAYRAKAETDAVEHLTQLAQVSGATLQGLKSQLSNDEYNYLVKNAGGEASVNAILVKNRPAESIIDKKIENGKYVIAYQDPVTKKVRIESTDLGTPANYTKSFDLGDKLMIVPDNFDPKKDTPIYIPKGAVPKTQTETQTEKNTSVISQYSSAFQPGVRLSDGTPTINDESGRATYGAWKEAIKEAPTKGITRADFIKTFGYLTIGQDGSIDSDYGLTPVEKKLVLGSQSGGSSSSSSSADVANPF